MLEFEKKIEEVSKRIKELRDILLEHPEFKEELDALEERKKILIKKIFSNLGAWEIVQLARHPDRPHSKDIIEKIFDDFFELHGDRVFGDDPAIIAGIGRIEDFKVVCIGQEKGRGTKERTFRNFGMPHPEGYRKALRVFKIAEKFSFPVITLVDTPGAYPGIGAEERGQAWAIAFNIFEMLKLRVPIIVFIIGEGGSGGALAIAVGDRIYALEYSIYSVISPEGCASILWRDSKKADRAAEALKLTSNFLKTFKIIDDIIKEPEGGAHRDPDLTAKRIKEVIIRDLNELKNKDIEEIIKERRERFRNIGFFKLK
ncbi:MAG: acetyl-CoA carboxylase carboxyltransferase subunit alpha [candidate division WOR-3 bacterium]|uniref:Acetyl-coenzyme A carboxylase carboxyl transferase subunit alpha n=1 Tax=candidate division WOR-3 bacterium TaxID=2052148 RepID=A0A7V3ZT01_UNCW3